MNSAQLQPQKAINPAYKKFQPKNTDIQSFIKKLSDCIKEIKLVDSKNESEEHLKSPIKKFLTSTFYEKNEINTKERIDLAIYLGNDSTYDVGVVIEAKRPSNKSEFPTTKNLNKKALQELLLYYLRERIDNKNNNIKHLVITNGLEWFFFKGSDFYDLFFKNKDLVKQYELFRDGLKDTSKNELFYNEIASKYIDEVKNKLPFVHLDFSKENLESLSHKKAETIYKVFSDVHLLGKSFGNDSNELNKAFYNELLHIIGLEEVKDKSQKLIRRKEEKARDYGSLLENTIFTLEDKDYLPKVKNIPNNEDKPFVVGLELCLHWVNRILFLKLLESQLKSYNQNKSEYSFLNFDFIDGFDSLNDLFFSALAKPIKERHQKYSDKFKNIPYLNSSLFEHSALESLTFDITALKDEDMNVYSSTILKDSNGKKFTGKINTLEYIFKFLDAYDFSAESGIDAEKQNGKTLINASVLGLIFEKINGYKDGSFYTPGTITMFMCKETLRKKVVEKFKELENQNIEDYDDVKDYTSSLFKKDDILRLNSIINSITICDPAVGSGHFLVSALNEMIAIKSDLNILADENGRKIPCIVQVENDELYISDGDGEIFEYQRKDPNSLSIQKTIFHEKETVIENCLFGVDINPNSVNICRLRLWIELLKNAYYTNEGELQTLPNIDINIKCGNSLISRFQLTDSLKSAFKNKDVTYTVEDYKNAVKEYKSTNSKNKKREVEEIISTIKGNFKSTLDAKIKDKVSKAVGEFQNEEQRQLNLVEFGQKITKVEKDNLKKLKLKSEKALQEKEEILNNVIYTNAFEWRFEFPEVLDDDGNYIGFDVIIGNPPYIQLQKMGADSDALEKLGYKTYARTGDIYSLFYELGYNILQEKGILNFITSNKWMRAAYGESLRKFFIENTNPEILIDFSGNQIFDTATVDTNILMFSKDKNRQQTQACIIKEKLLINLSDYFRHFSNITSFNTSDSWVILNEIEQRIKAKIEAMGTPLKDWDINIYRGILTGYNEAFIIDGQKKDELIAEDPKSAEIIRPILRGRDIKRYNYDFADLWLINTHNGIKEKGLKPVNTADYPAIKKHLDGYYAQLEKRADKGETPYNLRNCAYMEDFSKQKIVWKAVGKNLTFALLEGDSFLTAPASFITSDFNQYLLAFLSSSYGKFYIYNNSDTTGAGDIMLNIQSLEKIPIPKPEKIILEKINSLTDKILYNKKHGILTTEFELEVNNLIYSLFDFNKEEIEFIENQ